MNEDCNLQCNFIFVFKCVVMNSFANILGDAIANGEMVLGIAAGIDASLSSECKLRIKRNEKDVDTKVAFALSHVPVNPDPFLEEMYVNGVYSVFYYGAANHGDSDSVLTDERGPYSHKHVPDKVLIRNTMSLIASTKLNFFQTNHHTGQGALSGYPLKVFNALFNNELNTPVTPEITKMVHCLGHWAGTISVLRALGFTGMRMITVFPGVIPMSFGSDFKIRKDVMPSGTASLALCYVILKKIKGSNLKYALPDLNIVSRTAEMYSKVRVMKVNYHMSAKHLTGSEREPFDDHEFTGYLGCLGSFIVNIHPGSTINKSPRIKKGEVMIYKEHEGYSEEFESLCVAVRREMIKGIQGDISAYLPSGAKAHEERKEEVDAIFKAKFGG